MFDTIRKSALLLLLLSAASPAWSAIGNVTESDGSAWVENETSRTAAEPGLPLAVGDTLSTGQGSYMVFKLIDASIFKMNSNTILRIDEFHYDPSKPGGKGKIVLSLLQGSISVLSGDIGSIDPANFVIITPSGVVNAMQGEFSVSILNESMPDGLQVDGADVGTYITVGGGIVIFTNESGTELLEPGDTVFVPDVNTPPETPDTIPPGVDLDIDIGSGDGDDGSTPPDTGIPDPQTPIGSPEPSATPGPTGSPSPSGSPQPTGSPGPTGSPDPSGSPQPTGSPGPTGSPDPSGSPQPTGSPGPTGSPDPSGSPQPTGSPGPTGSPDPSGSPQPTATPDPSSSPQPTPSPSDQPDPSASPDPSMSPS